MVSSAGLVEMCAQVIVMASVLGGKPTISATTASLDGTGAAHSQRRLRSSAHISAAPYVYMLEELFGS